VVRLVCEDMIVMSSAYVIMFVCGELGVSMSEV